MVDDDQMPMTRLCNKFWWGFLTSAKHTYCEFQEPEEHIGSMQGGVTFTKRSYKQQQQKQTPPKKK